MKKDTLAKILIYNDVHFHYEIIPSVIKNIRTFFNIDTIPIQIYLYTTYDESFEQYIKTEYPHILLSNIRDYDYYINCTVYDKDFPTLETTQSSNKKYIAHEITKRLQNNPNVFFLTPLSINRYFYADILPFAEHKKPSSIPIYIIQGSLARRNISLLTTILDKKYTHTFLIKILCKGNLPAQLHKYKSHIIHKQKLEYINYHTEFLDAYCILPLITKQSHPRYYIDKVTSTINYALGYNLKCLLDKDLQNIYNLKNVEIFNNENDITLAFEKTLNSFYTGV